MSTKKKWAARAAVLGLTATLIAGLNTSSASAAISDCTPAGPHRPDGFVTRLIEPLFGLPGYPSTPLGDLPFTVSDLLDRVVCPVLP